MRDRIIEIIAQITILILFAIAVDLMEGGHIIISIFLTLLDGHLFDRWFKLR